MYNSEKMRNCYYDVLRVVAMMLVIGVHSVGSIEQYAVSAFGKTEALILDRLNSFYFVNICANIVI